MRRWFLPDEPDVLGLLVAQGRSTVAGLEHLTAWAGGDPALGAAVRQCGDAADADRRALLVALQRSFVTPVAPEDVFELSERLGRVLDEGKDLVRESELLTIEPDGATAEMAAAVEVGVRRLIDGFTHLADHPDQATGAADAAIGLVGSIDQTYRRAMMALLTSSDGPDVAGRRELYRRGAQMGEAVEHVAHRVWYAVVKES